MKTLWAHTLVMNEERYLWFAVTSVIDYVDKVLLWDTGSTDSTVKLIKELAQKYPKKISVNLLGKVDANEFTNVRQHMLEETQSDWFIIVDGDEVWWDDSIQEVVDSIHTSRDNLDSLVSRYYTVVGDIYHHQERAAGKYTIDGETGHLTIRAINCHIPNLRFGKPHGTQGVFGGNGTLIQEMDKKRRKHLRGHYMHFTHMLRSSVHKKDLEVQKRRMKFKHEIGKAFPLDFYYPEVFFRPRPAFIPSPWIAMNTDYFARAILQTPFKKIKRSVYSRTSGY